MNPSTLVPIKIDADIAHSSLCVRSVYETHGRVRDDSMKYKDAFTPPESTPIHRPPAVLVLSTTTSPLFITHFTLLSTTLMSASGSPSTATKSPRYPGATASVHTFPCPSHNFPNRTAFTDCAATFACPNAPGTKITIHAINATRTILIALL